MSLASNIKMLRERQGLTQEELARKVGVSQQAILNFEKDKNKPNIVTGVSIAKALGTTCEQLVGETAAV